MSLKIFLVTACIFSACVKPPQHVQRTSELTASFCQKAERNFGVKAIGQGGFFGQKTVNMLYADFEIAANFDEKKAKEILMQLASQLLEEANQRPSFTEYVAADCMDLSHISLSLAFVDPLGKPLIGPSQIHLYEGKLHYSAYNAEKKAYTSYKEESLST